jgi:tetratricopeptide (TPR) repeat protein
LLLLVACSLASAESPQELFDRGDFEAAAQAARASPDNAENRILLGRALLAADRPEAAVKALQDAVKHSPDSAEAHYRLGQALASWITRVNVFRQMGMAGDIGDAFKRAVELRPDNPEYRWALFEFYRQAPGIAGGGRDKAEKEAQRLAQLEPGRGHRARGALLLDDKKIAEAEEAYRAAVTAAPDIADHRAALGYFFQHSQRWDEAFATFEEIAKRFPKDMNAHYQIGKTAVLSGLRLEQGAAALKRYLQHKPKVDEPPLSWAHYRLGQIYAAMKNVQAARGEYEAALKLDPAHADARAALEALGG